jgi:HAMP domain-containing protein
MDLPSIVRAAIRVIDQVGAFVNAMRTLTEEHEDLRQRFGRLARDHEDLQEREAVARRDSEDTSRALADLRRSYEALLADHETPEQGAATGPEHVRAESEGGPEPLAGESGRLERAAILESEAAARRESEESAEALAELRCAYEALLAEHESAHRTVQTLNAERATLLEERRQMAAELGALVGSLRTGKESVAVGAPTTDG